MKTIIFTIAVFIGSVILEPNLNNVSASGMKSVSTYTITSDNPHINKRSAKRFKSAKVRRSKHTCMKKGGCTKPKGMNLFHKKATSCSKM